MNKLSAFFEAHRETLKAGAWIAFSAGATALISWLLEKPELAAYYGVLNFILFAIKEEAKKRR